MPSKTLAELADLVGGQLSGNTDIAVNNALPLQDAVAGCVTLIDDIKLVDRLIQSGASAVVTTQEICDLPIPALVVADLHKAFSQIVSIFRPPITNRNEGVDVAAHVDHSAQIGQGTQIRAGATVGANCRIGRRCVIHSGVHLMDDCVVGDDCIIFPNAILYERCQLGDRVLIHAGAVLGAYGFGYHQVEGRHVRSAQMGWVEVENDVEIGASVAIDRGAYGTTRIGEGTKLDNLVQIGHNCQIGKHNLICSQVGIAGSSTTGDYVVLAGQVGLADHIHLADKTIVGAQSGVMKDVVVGEVLLGAPAKPVKQAMQEFAMISKLPQMRKDLRSLSAKVKQLSDSDGGSDEQQRAA